jgi:glycosyltransferase involved in cell wall biosynthesis
VKRVLHLVAVPWSATDGVARACQAIACAVSDAEHVLVIDAPSSTTLDGFAGVRVVRGWSPALPWQAGFRAAVEQYAPDVVHLHGGELVPALAYAPVLGDLPVVASCYASTPSVAGLDRAARREHRANVSTARLVFARSGGLQLARRALATGRVAVVCTPDTRVARSFAGAGRVIRVAGAADVSPISARWSADPTVVFAGRAQSGRGVDDLVAAFPIVRAAIPSARLRLLLLPGDSAARWKTQLAHEQWADVRIGPVPDLATEFASAQVGAFPFRWPVTMTPALAAAEAMASGLPVVATRVECLTPLVADGVNGFLVSPRDPEALGRALARVIAGPDTWQALAQGARNTIEERWSWNAAAAAIAEAYDYAQRSAA